MSRDPQKLAALAVAAICLVAVGLSLTHSVEPRIANDTESAVQPLSIADQQPEPIKARVPVRIDLMESPEFPFEMLRRQRLQEALQIRNALELQQQMHEELNKRYRL